MQYEITYDNASPKELDARAIADTQDYLGERFNTLVAMFQDTTLSVVSLNIACSFAGVSGRPFHALARKYRLADYIEWRTTGKDANPNINAQGFPYTP